MSTPGQTPSDVMVELQKLIEKHGRREVCRCCLQLVAAWSRQGVAFADANMAQPPPQPELPLPPKQQKYNSSVNAVVKEVMATIRGGQHGKR